MYQTAANAKAAEMVQSPGEIAAIKDKHDCDVLIYKTPHPLVFDPQSDGKGKLDPSDVTTKDDLDRYYEQEIARLESEKKFEIKR